MDIIMFAHENGCPWDKQSCHVAALNGNLEALKYAHECGCPWSEYTYSMATLKGHLDVLKYLRENGCPLEWQHCRYLAKEHLHPKILNFLNS